MAEEFHKPTMFPTSVFEAYQGGIDPAESSRIAHETSHALLSRVRADPDAEIVDRLVAYTDEHGIDAIAELWSRASARSLPGALWRIYLLRVLIRQDPVSTSFYFERGVAVSSTIDPIVAGAEAPTGPDEITVLADQILRGLFEGDFAVALDRAAAFCRVTGAGCTSVADDLDVTEPVRSTELTRRALRYSSIAGELTSCARLWRSESLD
ncbi:DNA-directed RNA polymerase subunit beta [Labedella phragmitis]|uniref:DNA-directed RNA polymerase subunit beta n=1 Tax=Labedella phragmitis TaxID=2498849 RepID=A0A444PRL3_9MICO|nr:DNA-directed RNA polymerase subunit beta [Labedella phragmitis]RWZ49864.1 DNA-directed RNA polymerase subunit beta [Labedella phragmitis]